MTGAPTDAEHIVTQRGVRVRKSTVNRSGDSYRGCIELVFENRTGEAKIAGVIEEVPEACDLSETKGTDKDCITWWPVEHEDELRIQVKLDPDERTEVEYRPGSPHPEVFTELAERPPRIFAVESDDGVDGAEALTNGAPNTGQSNDRPPSSDGIVSEDHGYIDPPPGVDFSDVAGLYEVKRELRDEIIDPFTDPRYDEYDIGKANGVLFYGPPGTGKTYVATALAGELGYNFLPADMGMLRGSKLGQNVENIKELFEMAETNQPCVLFIDEIDGLAPERDADLHQARAEAVNELLHRVGDINERDADVVVIAATNRPDQVDDALKRTGRFDTRIKIGMPDATTRLAILEHELNEFAGTTESIWADREFLDTFVESTSNFAASDIVEVVESAQRASLRRSDSSDEPCITTDLIMEQVDDVAAKQEADTAGEFLTETPEIDFSDVGGMETVKQRMEETLLDPLQKPGLYEEYGLDVANGVLLYGPPGTGKTYLSRALAGEAGCSFLQITASDIVSKWVGEAAQNVQGLFEKAHEVAPAIVFIDEIDGIAGARGGGQMTNSEEQAVNELLAQISALDGTDVFVIGTTNRPDIIDDALTRAGRLGETIEVPPPDRETRAQILRKQLASRPFDPESVDWTEIKELTEMEAEDGPYVASDLAKIADEAARYAMDEAALDDLQPISDHHLKQAIEITDPSIRL